jgi:hypothetical protein
MAEVQENTFERPFSLVIGGPFHRSMIRFGLNPTPGPNIRRRIWFFVLVTWAPLLLLSLAGGRALPGTIGLPFLYDYSAHARFLICIPLLFAAEIVVDPGIGRAVAIFRAGGIVRMEDCPAFDAILLKIEKLRDSGLTEAIILLVSLFPMAMFASTAWRSAAGATWHHLPNGTLSAAGWWFMIVSSTSLRFLMLRWLWRYLLWSYLLHRIASLDLVLLGTHPDGSAGLDFVTSAQRHFAFVFLAGGVVVAGEYGNDIAYFGLPVQAILIPALIYVILSVLAVLGPIALLAPQLVRTRKRDMIVYGRLGRELTASFDAKWIGGKNPSNESLLGHPDPSSLIDFAGNFAIIKAIQPVPVSRGLVLQVAAYAGLPFGLLYIVASPINETLKQLAKMLL